MALIVDPDQLNQGVEIDILTAGPLTVRLNIAGNLSTDGVLERVVYSFIQEEILSDPNLSKYPRIITPITNEFFELGEGWDWHDDATRFLLRSGGFLVRNVGGQVISQHANIQTIGTIGATDQVYYDNGDGATDFELAGPVNQAIQILSDPNGDGNFVDGFDRRTSFKIFVREQGKLFDTSSLADLSDDTLENPKAFGFGLTTGTDPKITASDVEIDANSDGTPDVAPYSGMSITYLATPTTRDIGGTNRSFGIVIDGNNGTAEQIYEFVQFQLRRNADIDDGAGGVIGKTADELLEFVGDELRTKFATNPIGGGGGVYIDNFQAIDTNRLRFQDNTDTSRSFPFVAVVTLQFNDVLQAASTAKYWVFFTDPDGASNGNEWPGAGAIIVDDNSDTPVAGNVSGQSEIQFDFDYDGNVQGGRTGGTETPITVIASAAGGAQYAIATGVITRSVENLVSVQSQPDRNYLNPV